MKIKFRLLTAALFIQGIWSIAISQTNTFPANGNVGIGTLAPADKLTILTASNVVGIAHSNGAVRLSTVINNSGGFFGTATNHPLFFRTNNNGSQVTLLQNGNLGIATTTPRSKLEVFGSDAYINTIRVGLGGYAGDSTFDNTCLGKEALNNTLDINVPEEAPWAARYNTAIGRAALRDNFNGGYNTAVGAYALAEGSYDGNTAVGFYSLSNNHGSFNSALGMQSLWQNDDGDYNCAFGYESLTSNTDGNDNTAIGHRSLYRNSTANFNTAVGSYAMYQNTTGTLNTAIGYRSLDSNSTGQGNTGCGTDALWRNKTGNSNTATGSNALGTNTTGSFNTAMGRYALTYTVSGGTNTAIGYFASPSTGALSNTTSLGYNARPTASNSVRAGNSTVTSIGGYANWTNISDGRVKKNIKENVPGLEFINKLQPVTYNLSVTEAEKITGAADNKPGGMEKENEAQQASRKEKEAIVYTGFVAQDVEKAAQSLHYSFSGVDAAKNDKDLYGLRYAEFVVPLVKAVQELSKKNDDLQKEVEALKALIQNNSKNDPAAKQNIQLTDAKLEQNIPNPFADFTTIKYTLPQKRVQAKIVITGNDGKVCKEISIAGAGKGSVNVNTALLAAGTYRYSLYINNSLADTRQMVLSR